MPQIEVYCTVSNCDYWGKNNHCFAEKILITNDKAAEQWPDAVDAPQASTLMATPASYCQETACKTFRPRGSSAGPVQDLRQSYGQLT